MAQMETSDCSLADTDYQLGRSRRAFWQVCVIGVWKSSFESVLPIFGVNPLGG